MSKKRKEISHSNNGHKWTDEEQQCMEKLFHDGTLSVTDNASKVKASDITFDEFSNSVVAYHWGQFKKKVIFFYEVDVRIPRNFLIRFSVSLNSHRVGPVSKTLEQFGVIRPSQLNQNSSSSIDLNECDDSRLICDNMPFIRFSYMHYESKKEKLVVIIDLPGGSGDFKWKFNELGDSMTLLVSWGRAMYEVSTLFQIELQQKTMTMDHPKLHAMQCELLRKGISANSTPQSSISIPLGKRVQKTMIHGM